MPIRTVLIEDARQFAEALANYISVSDSGVECTGMYSTAEEALKRLPKDPPDVALVDINLPGMSGIELVARLKEACPSVLCLILTTYEDSIPIFNALKAGACGYLLKRAPADEIVSAVVQAHAGGSPMSPQIARQVVGFFHKQPVANGTETLSDREREVLQLLAEGSMYKEIATRLGISIDTVRTHVRKIYEKLHVHSRTEAVLKYLGTQR
ncbi:MAG: response regulator transcription factor [Verrucomicrobiaceae bacterium]|nr:MAG: response regulator transcription factor [Verrucomicrobiaceae bacterium]